LRVDHGCYLLAELDRVGCLVTASGLAADGTGP
jgi:hypothetical protein